METNTERADAKLAIYRRLGEIERMGPSDARPGGPLWMELEELRDEINAYMRLADPARDRSEGCHGR